MYTKVFNSIFQNTIFSHGSNDKISGSKLQDTGIKSTLQGHGWYLLGVNTGAKTVPLQAQCTDHTGKSTYLHSGFTARLKSRVITALA